MKKGYVVILKGFNIGKELLTKALARTIMEESEYRDFEVVSTSGNLIVYTDYEENKVLQDVLNAFNGYYGKKRPAYIRSIDEFILFDQYLSNSHTNNEQYILFSNADIQKELQEFFMDIDTGFEKVETFNRFMYWETPKGGMLTGFGRIALGHLKYKKVVTYRDMYTIKKIIECIYND